jgi:hypothetical protein
MLKKSCDLPISFLFCLAFCSPHAPAQPLLLTKKTQVQDTLSHRKDQIDVDSFLEYSNVF